MKTSLPNVDNGLCPFCGLSATAEGVIKTLLNKIEGDYLVECTCNNRYFVLLLDEGNDGL